LTTSAEVWEEIAQSIELLMGIQECVPEGLKVLQQHGEM
jgi:hypothetical protein